MLESQREQHSRSVAMGHLPPGSQVPGTGRQSVGSASSMPTSSARKALSRVSSRSRSATCSRSRTAAGAGGPLTAGGTSLLPLQQAAGPGGDLSRYLGQPARADGVRVQSVPADEGFWVGTSETDRIWVQLTGTGESGYRVRRGDRVDFTGRVVPTPPGFAQRVGLSAADGAEQLQRQQAHLEVAKNAVRLHK